MTVVLNRRGRNGMLMLGVLLLQACTTVEPAPQISSVVLGTVFDATHIGEFPPLRKGANVDEIRIAFPEMERMNLDVVRAAFYSSILSEEEYAPFESISMREVYNEGLDRVEFESPIYPTRTDGSGLRSLFQQIKSALEVAFGTTETVYRPRENFRNKQGDSWMQSLSNEGRRYTATWVNPEPKLGQVVLAALGANENSGHLRLTVYFRDPQQ